MKKYITVCFSLFIILSVALSAMGQTAEEKKAIDEIKSLLSSPKGELFNKLETEFLSRIKEEKLRQSLLLMFTSSPPKLVVSKGFLPEYIPDTYTLYVPDKNSPAVNYLLGHYISHILYGKAKYKELAGNLLLKENFNAVIRLQNPLWFYPGKDNEQLAQLGTKMNEKGTWLIDLARFFALVIEDKGFEKSMWERNSTKNDKGKIFPADGWHYFIPEKTEGYPLSVLYDVYDHEAIQGTKYYEDDDSLNVRNGLDIVLSIILSKEINDFRDFEIYFGEIFGSLELKFREVITKNNWQLIMRRDSELKLVKDYKFPKVLVHPQISSGTEFDKRQLLCKRFEIKITRQSTENDYIQFVAPLDYVPTLDKCEGAYVVLEIIREKGKAPQAKLKEGPVRVSVELATVKKDLEGGEALSEGSPASEEEQQEEAIPPAAKKNLP